MYIATNFLMKVIPVMITITIWLFHILQPEVAIDMKRRYIGHCNVGTDIKQASFLGQQGALSKTLKFDNNCEYMSSELL